MSKQKFRESGVKKMRLALVCQTWHCESDARMLRHLQVVLQVRLRTVKDNCHQGHCFVHHSHHLHPSLACQKVSTVLEKVPVKRCQRFRDMTPFHESIAAPEVFRSRSISASMFPNRSCLDKRVRRWIHRKDCETLVHRA